MAARDAQLKILCSGETFARARDLLNQVHLLCIPGSGYDVPADGRVGLPAICAMIASEQYVSHLVCVFNLVLRLSSG